MAASSARAGTTGICVDRASKPPHSSKLLANGSATTAKRAQLSRPKAHPKSRSSASQQQRRPQQRQRRQQLQQRSGKGKKSRRSTSEHQHPPPPKRQRSVPATPSPRGHGDSSGTAAGHRSSGPQWCLPPATSIDGLVFCALGRALSQPTAGSHATAPSADLNGFAQHAASLGAFASPDVVAPSPALELCLEPSGQCNGSRCTGCLIVRQPCSSDRERLRGQSVLPFRFDFPRSLMLACFHTHRHSFLPLPHTQVRTPWLQQAHYAPSARSHQYQLTATQQRSVASFPLRLLPPHVRKHWRLQVLLPAVTVWAV